MHLLCSISSIMEIRAALVYCLSFLIAIIKQTDRGLQLDTFLPSKFPLPPQIIFSSKDFFLRSHSKKIPQRFFYSSPSALYLVGCMSVINTLRFRPNILENRATMVNEKDPLVKNGHSADEENFRRLKGYQWCVHC